VIHINVQIEAQGKRRQGLLAKQVSGFRRLERAITWRAGCIRDKPRN